MFKVIVQAIRTTLLIALLTGIVFPLSVTFISQLCFPILANGSLLKSKDGQIIGSSLIAQAFSQPQYFHPRPSAAGSGYAAEASSASNLGPASKKLIEGVADDPQTKSDETFLGVKQLAANFRKENGLSEDDAVPVDAITRSGSGLDPHITPENAQIQAKRVAAARHCDVADILNCVSKAIDSRQFGILGEPGINVLKLNQVLDERFTVASHH
ncbi:MAG: potassium-transporting ATPase subunit KdpC [Candidatus Obscuribacterales bacterium]|nr:potassium-transporting ATPase subunit KdpC [Candidatus Obscuribacterales bacterium]